jgi:hypothetical protein
VALGAERVLTQRELNRALLEAEAERLAAYIAG